MGGASTGKGGVADAGLNVVPFIDLLACTICFLLISAVWTQMSRIDVDQALPKQQPRTQPEPPKKVPKINVAITPGGYLVNLVHVDGKPELAVPKRIATAGELRLCRGKGKADDCDGTVESYRKYDRPALREQLEQLMRASGVGDQVKVMVAAKDDVPYLHLIGTLDTVLGSCADPARQTCLRQPSVGDIGLLRAEGFAGFD